MPKKRTSTNSGAKKRAKKGAKKGSRKISTLSERFGPEGAISPTRAQLTSILMETFPNPMSGLPFRTVAQRIGALYHVDAVKKHPARGVEYTGQEALTNEYQLCMNAIPDMQIETEQPKFRQDGTVEVKWVLTGTHTGDFRGVPPSGEKVRIEGVDRFKLDGTLIKEHEVFTNYDELGWNGIIVGSEPPDVPLFPEDETDTP